MNYADDNCLEKHRNGRFVHIQVVCDSLAKNLRQMAHVFIYGERLLSGN
jgi:hypothetical protein